MVGKGQAERKKEAVINHLYKRVTGEIDPYDLIDYGPRWKSLVSEGRNVYGTAKNMTDYLADQFGDPAIIRYFAELGQTGNRESAFLRAFGMSHNEFIEKYKACFLQAKNACICNGRTNAPGPAFLLLATCHNRMANPVTWPVKNNEMTVVH